MARVEARTTVAPETRLGTQVVAPSKAGWRGVAPAVTDISTAPLASSLSSRPGEATSVTQTLLPSKTAPFNCRPMDTVVTVQGIVAPGVTIETVPLPLAVQIRAPS